MTDIDKKDGSGTLQSEDTKTAAVKKEVCRPYCPGHRHPEPGVHSDPGRGGRTG